MAKKKLLKIIKDLWECGLPTKALKEYRLKIKNDYGVNHGIVIVKLYHKGKLVLTFKEGFKGNKIFECSREEHNLLTEIHQCVYYNDHDMSW